MTEKTLILIDYKADDSRTNFKSADSYSRKIGLEKGDHLVALNSEPLSSTKDLKQLRTKYEGQEIEYTIVRNGKKIIIKSGDKPLQARLESVELVPNLVKKYTGKQSEATEEYEKDLKIMSIKGYKPTDQNWVPGQYDMKAFLIGLVLAIFVIGVLIWIYMLIVKPAGVLSVNYELRSTESLSASNINEENTPISQDTKECPECAEHIKAAAKVCRFCRYRFDEEPQTVS